MKVLYAAQISNNTIRDNNPQFLFETDACYNLCVGIVNTLATQNPDWEFVVLLPDESLGVDIPNHNEKFEYNVDVITYDSPVGPGNTRMHFDYPYWQKLVEDGWFTDIDVMINDQNTLTKNWNMLFLNMNLSIPIVSTNYYMDTPLSEKVPKKIRYYERQMESFINSDLTAHQSQANFREAMAAMNLLYKREVVQEAEERATIWRTGVQAEEITPYNTDERFSNITCYFGNRISDTANRYNNYHIFAQAIGVLQRDHESDIKDVDFVLLNPTRKVTEQQYSDILLWSQGRALIMDNDEPWNRDMYMDFINKAHISCNLFTNEVHGGVTHAEAMLSNNIVIMPDVNNYSWKYDQTLKEYPFLVDPILKDDFLTIEPEALAEKMLLAIKTIKGETPYTYQEYCDLNQKLAMDFESYEVAAIQIKEDLMKLVEQKNLVEA